MNNEIHNIAVYLPYGFTLGATMILFIYHGITYYYTRDFLLKDFSIYLLAMSIHLAHALFSLLTFDDLYHDNNNYVIIHESLEVLTYFFYIRYTTNAINFDVIRHKMLKSIINITLIAILVYIVVSYVVLYLLEWNNLPIFIGIRLIMFGLAILMFWKSFEIRNNRILKYIQLGSIFYFIFGIASFSYMFVYKSPALIVPYHFILLGTLIDLVIYSVAMSDRIKHLIIEAEKIASEKEIELQSAHLRQQITIQEEKSKYSRKIAMDLHDDVGGTISSMKIYSELAEKYIDTKPAETKNILQKLTIQAQQVMNKLNDVVWSLKSLDDENASIKSRVNNSINDLLSAREINTSFNCDDEFDKLNLNPEAKRNILLIIKESFNNIAKHSNAENVKIDISVNQGSINISITDDGIGFEPTHINKGSGLVSIEDRVNSMNGHCQMVTSNGNGCTTSIFIPIATISYSET